MTVDFGTVSASERCKLEPELGLEVQLEHVGRTEMKAGAELVLLRETEEHRTPPSGHLERWCFVQGHTRLHSFGTQQVLVEWTAVQSLLNKEDTIILVYLIQGSYKFLQM